MFEVLEGFDVVVYVVELIVWFLNIVLCYKIM